VLRRVGFQHVDSNIEQLRWEIKRQPGSPIATAPNTD
jgi:hypothetical protein